MARNFVREYRLIIGKPERINNFVIPKSLANPRFIVSGTNGVSTPNTISRAPKQSNIFRANFGDFEYFDTIPRRFTEITKLQMTATVAQTKEGSGTPCTISVYNLDQNTINNIRKDDLVILKAGYRSVEGDFIETVPAGTARQDHPDIFIGQILQVHTEFPEQDSITTIVCGEALTTKRNSKVSKSYRPGTTRLEVLNDLLGLVKTQGVPVGTVTLPEEGTSEHRSLNEPLKLGYVAKGMLFGELDRLCKSINMRSFTSLGKIHIEPISETRITNLVQTEATRTQRRAKATTIINITPDQVKGEVQPSEGGSGRFSNSGNSAQKKGVQLTTYLNGNISVDLVMRLDGFVTPGDQRTDDKDINGEYRIVSVVHKLDFRSEGTWDTTATLEAL